MAKPPKLDFDQIADVAMNEAENQRQDATRAAHEDRFDDARLHNDTAKELDRIEENLRRQSGKTGEEE